MAKLTFHGHSAVELELAGRHVWVDPFLTGNPKAVVKADAVRADVIVITHGHSDHVGDAVAIAKRTGAVIAGAYEVTTYCHEQGVARTEPANIGGTVPIGPINVTLTMAWHSSAIESPNGAPRYMGPSAGAVIKGEGKAIYHMGDTGLFSDIKLIAERLGPFQVALVPCGDRFTMGVDDAALAASWINARMTVPIHFGTFPIIGDNGAAFVEALTRRGLAGKALAPGESIEF